MMLLTKWRNMRVKLCVVVLLLQIELGLTSSSFNNEGFRFSILQSPGQISSYNSDDPPFPGSDVIDDYSRQRTKPKKSNESGNESREKSVNDNHHSIPQSGIEVLKTDSKGIRKPMKGKVLLDFGTDREAQNMDELKFRSLSNLIHGTTSKVKGKIHSFQNPTEKASENINTEQPDKRKGGVLLRPKSFKNDDKYISKGAKVQLSIDPASACRMLPFIFCAVSSFTSAFFGSLRFLGPLVLGRRAINWLGNCLNDYMTGRYFRKTYTRLERAYLHYYEMPAAFRAICRTTAQLIVYYLLAPIMAWLVGINHPPCHAEGLGLATFCSMLYILAILGTGHAFSTAVSVWGGPLRIQSANHNQPNHSNLRSFFEKPWVLLKLLKDPEELLNGSSASEVPKFEPNPLLFPVTWLPLHFLHIYAISKVLSTNPKEYIFCPKTQNLIPVVLRQFFLQQTLGDEWCRVFLAERRVGLGVAVILSYFIAILWSAITSARMNAKMAAFMLPSVLAALISVWMNFIVFYNRIDIKQKKSSLINGKKQTIQI